MVFLNFYNVPLKESKGLSRMVSCFYCFLQMVIVRQNLHQKVELKRLGLKERKESERGEGQVDGKLCLREGAEPGAYLWSLHLDPPHTPRTINDSILRNDFTGVDLTEGSDDAAVGEDHIPSNISWTIKS